MSVDKKLVIGITGFIKSGKTLTAQYFKNHGFHVIDVDRLAHSLYKRATPLYKKILNIFGNNILKPDSTIDRKKLGRLVFSSKSIYKKFCSLVYPALNKTIITKIKSLRHKIIILDMAVLFETGIYKKIDYVIFIMVSKKKWQERINNYPNAVMIKKIFNFQNIFKLSKKIALSDFIIYNNGNKKELYDKVRELSKKIKENLWKKKMKNK
ncbi:MAG: dephospho-CoA kinase [Candidatus Goldbacteria bacterium]|nr:dephospho-CoA kinase [Candidatus Goldiibacteriota bacterium]